MAEEELLVNAIPKLHDNGGNEVLKMNPCQVAN